jgi:hypothetical protein
MQSLHLRNRAQIPVGFCADKNDNPCRNVSIKANCYRGRHVGDAFGKTPRPRLRMMTSKIANLKVLREVGILKE